MNGADLHITQPGVIKVRGTISRNGYSAYAEYSVSMVLNWTVYANDPSYTGYAFNSSPGGGSDLGIIPLGAYVEFTETTARTVNGVIRIYGKTTYNGKTGWIGFARY